MEFFLLQTEKFVRNLFFYRLLFKREIRGRKEEYSLRIRINSVLCFARYEDASFNYKGISQFSGTIVCKTLIKFTAAQMNNLFSMHR